LTLDILAAGTAILAAFSFSKIWMFGLFFLGLSLVIFVHELGHFLVARWCDVRIEKFAIGFGREIFGWTRGETRYAVNALPLGGYVKMLGQEDFAVDKTGELVVKPDPRSYSNKSVGQRMMIVSAGVVMNVIFAAAFFMVAFMVGMEVIPAKVGMVLPDKPAFRAGIRPGDRILAIDGHQTDEWADVMMRITLSDPGDVMRLDVENDNQRRVIQVEPEYSADNRLRQIGISNPQSLTVAGTGWAGGLNDGNQLQVEDEIIALQGKPVTDVNKVFTAVAAAEGKPVEITVKRKVLERDPSGRIVPATKELRIVRRARITLLPAESPNLLGAMPRVRIGDVVTGGAAYKAGLREGDVIAEWDGIRNPTWDQVTADILKYPETDQRVLVIRDGKPLNEPLLVRPEKPFSWSGNTTAQPGVFYRGEIDEENLVLSRVLPDSPMARAGLGAADQIQAVAGKPVTNWYEFIEALKQNNGKTVPITFLQASANGQIRTSDLAIPGSLTTRLGLTSWPDSVILSIDGKKTVQVRDPQGRPLEYSVSTWEGAGAALQGNIGKSVDVEYMLGDKTFKKTVEVTADLADPWAMHVWYVEPLMTFAQRDLMQTSNPFTATWWGIKKTEYFLINTYITIKQMLFSQQIGVEHLSGPVGIMRIGTQVAESGLAQLIYFLAFLSANFAVVNFLPFPIVDGGHFVFLLIEKIKGKPLSIRVQMVTQVIGLAMILGAFIFLTVQDIIMWNKR
jgi:regulator of sigma E protease